MDPAATAEDSPNYAHAPPLHPISWVSTPLCVHGPPLSRFAGSVHPPPLAPLLPSPAGRTNTVLALRERIGARALKRFGRGAALKVTPAPSSWSPRTGRGR